MEDSEQILENLAEDLVKKPKSKKPPKTNGRRNQVIGYILLFFSLLALLAFVFWWEVYRNYEMTDDAYVAGNAVIVTSRQVGSVIAIYADNTDFIEEGQLLVELDPADHLLNLEQKKSALEQTVRFTKQLNDPLIEQSKNEVREAYLSLKKCLIFAPISGYVAKRNVQIGQTVQPTTPLLSIVSLDDLWIDANFKETQLENIRIGQPAEVQIDMYGSSVIFEGKVVGIQGASGSVFSLLPPQNASGNWIKVIQRVPVKISLNPKQVRKHPLFIGLSAYAKVLVSNTEGQVLSEEKPIQTLMKTDVFDISFENLNSQMEKIVERNLGKAFNKDRP